MRTPDSAQHPLLQLREIRREFRSGDETLVVLNNVNLEIDAGEFVALVGPSGSGKSTLMNVLGCLDRATSGAYRVAGRSTAQMSSDQLAELRREHFGFIFQRYHLLPDLTALGNVEIPAVYAGLPQEVRHERARSLLARLSLQDRLNHRPSQLSGGQQQRVSIARALMNGGKVILADEPTGALDRKSGEAVLGILKELHVDGHTVIVVTHDMAVAAHAERIIEISDGEIVADRGGSENRSRGRPKPKHRSGGIHWQVVRDRLCAAFRMAVRAMAAHRVRTFLTMLGVIIGIASVVSVVAIGDGARQRVLTSIGGLGTNTIEVRPGSGFGDFSATRVQTLRAADAEALAGQAYVDSATPNVSSSVTARYANVAAGAQVSGVGEQYFRVHGMKVAAGALFDSRAVDRMDQSVVIDQSGRDRFFPQTHESPLGKVLLLGKVPFRIVAVVATAQRYAGGSNLTVWVPYTTAMGRMLGQSAVSSITVRVADAVSMSAAERAITKLLMLRHGRVDFFAQNSAEIRGAIESATRTLTLLIGSIAAISLVVGGIGVMNIMLVSVSERTREIGVRIAVGGRRSDILQQFLIEAVLVCLIGGTLGIALALGLGVCAGIFWKADFDMVFSTASIIAAVVFSSVIGIAFGFLPARNAAALDPVEALARE